VVPEALQAALGKTIYAFYFTLGADGKPAFPYMPYCFRGDYTPMQGGMPGGGPKACTTSADCTGACPPGSNGCTCAPVMNGKACVPSCTVDMDCPAGPMGMPTTCKQGVCAP